MGIQYRGNRLAVPILLKAPEREERGDFGIAMGGCDEQIAEVADRVQLDVVHVAQAPQHVVIEAMSAERVGQIKVAHFERCDHFGVLLDRQLHAIRSTHGTGWMG